MYNNSSLFLDSEHSGFYALPYSVQRPSARHNHDATGFAEQSAAASAAPDVQTEREQRLLPTAQPSPSWSDQAHRDNFQNRAEMYFHRAKASSVFGSASTHDTEDRRLDGLNSWNPLMAHFGRTAQDNAVHSGQHTFFSQSPAVPKQPHTLWARQQPSSFPNLPYSFTRPSSAASNVTADTLHTAPNDPRFHHFQQIGLLQRSQVPFSSTTAAVSSQPGSDPDSPECSSPFSPASSQISSVDFVSDSTTVSGGEEAEDIRETLSSSSMYVPDSGHYSGALDSYELMARLATRLAAVSPTLGPNNAKLPHGSSSAHDNLRRALSPADMTLQQQTNRESIGRSMHRTYQTSALAAPVQPQLYSRAAPGAALLQPFMHSSDPISANPQRPYVSSAALVSTHAHIVDSDRVTQQPYGYSIVYEVEFKRNTLRFVSVPGLEDLTVGEFVFVEADRGEHLGQVHQILLLNSPPVIQPVPNNCTCPGGVCMSSDCDSARQFRNHASSHTVVGRVLRRATMKDIQKITLKSKEETKATTLCNQKVKDYVLEMEVVDAEFQYDMKKLTFFYKAQQRVDFRELVRDLYKLYRARIWMQKVEDAVLV